MRRFRTVLGGLGRFEEVKKGWRRFGGGLRRFRTVIGSLGGMSRFKTV